MPLDSTPLQPMELFRNPTQDPLQSILREIHIWDNPQPPLPQTPDGPPPLRYEDIETTPLVFFPSKKSLKTLVKMP